MARKQIFRGDRLAEARKSMKYTQEDLAQAIGAGTAQIGRYESDGDSRAEPSPEVTVRLAQLLEVSVDWLYGLTDQRKGFASESHLLVSPTERKLLEAYRSGDLRELLQIATEQPPQKDGKKAWATEM